MKKISTFIVSMFSLILLSCGTTKVVPSEETTIPSAPTVEESTDQIIEETEPTIVEEEIIEDTLDNLVQVEEEQKEEDVLPLPDIIEEPEVITITPSQIEEALNKKEEKQEEPKEEYNEELVLLDELPPLPEVEVTIGEIKPLDETSSNTDSLLPSDTDNLEYPIEDEIVDNVVIDSTEETIETSPVTIEDATTSDNNIVSDSITNPIVSTNEEEKIEEDIKEDESIDTENEELVETETEDIAEEEIKEDVIKPSRSVTVKRREYIDISYPGTGWIYMGATDNSKDVTYFGRDLGTKDTNFSLQAKNAGTKILHFYKNDLLTGEYLDDYVEVIILDEIGSNKTHIAAPSYEQPLTSEAKELYYTQEATTDVSIDNEVKEDEEEYSYETPQYDSDEGVFVISDEDDVIEILDDDTEEEISITNIDTDTLLKEAQLLYNEKEFSSALEKIEEFLSYAAKKVDEGLYLKGQILEAKSEIQDIKGAINAYSTLTREYPASKYWNEANKRIVYLKRFYLEVR